MINIFWVFLPKGEVDLSAQHDVGRPQLITLPVLLVPFYHPRKGSLGLQKKSIPLGWTLASPSFKPPNLYPIHVFLETTFASPKEDVFSSFALQTQSLKFSRMLVLLKVFFFLFLRGMEMMSALISVHWSSFFTSYVRNKNTNTSVRAIFPSIWPHLRKIEPFL